MTVTGLELAGEIIRRSSTADRSVTNLSVQKLAYFCHGWHLALKETPLVAESFEAWKFGPVLPSVYHKFKVFSSNPIPAAHPMVSAAATLSLDAGSSGLVDKVLEVYGRYSGAQLVDMSHAPLGPWTDAWNTGAATIDNNKIQSYFRSLIKQ